MNASLPDEFTRWCRHCTAVIREVDSRWCDDTLLADGVQVDSSFAALCGEGAEFHEPLTPCGECPGYGGACEFLGYCQHEASCTLPRQDGAT